EDLIALLKARPGLTGLVHAFAGPWELARRYLDLGFKLGIGGIATWPTARKLQGAVERCPADGYVLETDAPDLSPEWRRGERNEPREIGAIAQAVARLRGEEPEAVLASSDANGRAVFQLKVK
ncbi:MAG TPA: TatD family hydrolase, partial [Stenomitos sp.]